MPIEQIREALSKKNLIIGSRETIKYLKNKKVKLVMISKNCPENMKTNLENLSKSQNIKIESYEGTSKQLGVFLGRPFPVAAVSIKSESK